MSTQLAIILSYALIIIVVSAVLSIRNRKNSSSKFMAAEKELGIAMCVVLSFSEAMGGGTTAGVAQAGYLTGMSAVWVMWAPAVGYIVAIVSTMVFFLAMNRKYGSISVAGTFGNIFDGRCRTVMFIAVAFSYMLFAATEMVSAAGIIAPVFGISQDAALWLVALALVIMSMCGMKGVATVGIIHTAAISFGLGLVAALCVHRIGGVQAVFDQIPAEHTSLLSPNIGTVAANILSGILSTLIGAQYAATCFSAKSIRTAKKSLSITAVLLVIFALFPTIIGMSGRILVSGEINSAQALYMTADQFGPVISGIASVGVLAAIFSTAPGFLLMISTTIVRDGYHVYHPKARDRELAVAAKLFVVIIAVLAVFVGKNANSILGITYGAMQIRSVAGGVLIVAMFWPRVNSTSAFWAMLSGGLVSAVWYILGDPFGVSALWPGMAVGFAVLIPLSFLAKEKISDSYRRYREAIEEFKFDPIK